MPDYQSFISRFEMQVVVLFLFRFFNALDAKLFYLLPFVTPTMLLDDLFLLRKFLLNPKPLECI
jgi:hypothetical protein